jgi:DNA-binding FadR family transcriptional regulator
LAHLVRDGVNDEVTVRSAAEQTDEVAVLRRYMAELVATKTNRLPPEPELCTLLGLRRNQVRKALRALEAKGLIWRHVGKGTFIGQPRMTVDDLKRLVNPQDVLEARLMVEPTITSFAALRASPDDLRSMRECLVQLKANQDSYLEWHIWDDRLHRLIASSARNPMFLAIVDLLCANTGSGLRQRLEQVYGNTRLDDRIRDQEAIVTALEERDPQRAELLMRAYLLGIRRRVFGDR